MGKDNQINMDTDFVDAIRAHVVNAIPGILLEEADQIGDQIAEALLTDRTIASRLRNALAIEFVPDGNFAELDGELRGAFFDLPGSARLFDFPSDRRLTLPEIVAALKLYREQIHEITESYERDRRALSELRKQQRALGTFLRDALNMSEAK